MASDTKAWRNYRYALDLAKALMLQANTSTQVVYADVSHFNEWEERILTIWAGPDERHMTEKAFIAGNDQLLAWNARYSRQQAETDYEVNARVFWLKDFDAENDAERDLTALAQAIEVDLNADHSSIRHRFEVWAKIFAAGVDVLDEIPLVRPWYFRTTWHSGWESYYLEFSQLHSAKYDPCFALSEQGHIALVSQLHTRARLPWSREAEDQAQNFQFTQLIKEGLGHAGAVAALRSRIRGLDIATLLSNLTDSVTADAMAFGRLTKVNARDYWKNEEQDFTPWLAQAENMVVLSDALGLDLTVKETEVHVGPYRADIVANDAAGAMVVIENQLEKSDHRHLGQLFTYAASMEAAYVVWICTRVTEEHRKAIDWLNQHSDQDISFFACELELYRIGDSLPAPKFQVICRPNEWAKNIKTKMGGITVSKKAVLRRVTRTTIVLSRSVVSGTSSDSLTKSPTTFSMSLEQLIRWENQRVQIPVKKRPPTRRSLASMNHVKPHTNSTKNRWTH